jgi:N-methylhydantoinase A
VLVNARLAVVGELPALPVEPELPPREPAVPSVQRRIWLDGWLEVPVFTLETLAPGQNIEGPAIVEAPTTTILLRRGERGRVDTLGWLDIEVAADSVSGR